MSSNTLNTALLNMYFSINHKPLHHYFLARSLKNQILIIKVIGKPVQQSSRRLMGFFGIQLFTTFSSQLFTTRYDDR